MSKELTKAKRPKMDWEQVRQHGGPPCFAVLDGRREWYCGRSQRWMGHDDDHEYVSLERLLAKLDEMREALKRAEWDFQALISRGDLADEPRAYQTLRILQAALAQHHDTQREKQ